MKRTWKQIGSLFLAVCMVLTMLPTMAFAETGDVDSGTPPLGTSGIITAFGSLEPEILAQTVKTGTLEKELNLPGTLAVTVTESVYDIASGSDATKQDTQSTVAVEHWTSDPAYDGDVAGDYTFTPSLALSEGLTVAEGVYAPQITVTVEETATPLARGGVALMSGSVTGTMDIGGQTDVGLAANASGTGWAWDATTATLTLNSSYQGGYIKFECAGIDIINLSCTSAVTVNQGSTYAIQSSGSLVIKGDGPLTISDGGIKASKDIVILGVMGNINSGGSDGISAGGSVTISGTVGDITSTTYTIYANGDITISDGAVVGKIGAGGTGSKSGTHGIYADGSVTIHGTTGNISGMYYGIRANGGDVIIGGKTGAIDCALSASSDESSGIRAKVSVTITSTGETGAISSKKDYGIYAETGNVLISGTTGDITGVKVFGIYAAAGGITISPSAVVGNIAGAQRGIDAGGHVTIGGKTGDITGVTGSIYGGGINANLSVAIYGETGDITSTHPSIPAIGAGGDVSIIGSVGKIAVISSGSGSGCGIYADGGIHIMKSVTVSSFNGAFNKAPATLPSSYTATWSDSVDGSGSSSGSTYTWSSSHKYVKITKADSSKLAVPEGLTWDTTTPGKAKWTAVANATSYTVRLYKDGTFKTASPPTITAPEYDFTSDITTVGSYTFTVTAIGTAPNFVNSDESTASPVYVMADGGTIIQFITVTGIVEPVGGEVPVKTGATVPAGANYALRENIVWVDDENKTEPMADGAKFEAGKRYHFAVSVLLPSGHSFASDVTATINGKTATVTLDGTKGAVVTYLFTAKDAADTPTITITKHPQSITVTQGKINEILMAEAVSNNGKPVLYQWRQFIGGIGSDNTQPMLGETSNTLAIPKGLPAGTYQYLCVFNTDDTDYVDSNTAIVTVNPPSGGGGNGGGSNNGGTGGGSYTPPSTTTPPQAPPNLPITATAPVTATAGTNGTANANIPASAISDAIVRAQTAARAQGSSANGISIGLNVTMPQGATSLTAEIPQSALQSLVTAGVSQFTVNGAPVSLGLNQSALRAIQSQASGGITIGMTPVAGLSASAQSMIGSRPVYNITISYTDKSGKTQNITSFGSGTATLAIPYTPGRNEAVGYLYGMYVDGNGNASRIPGSVYDANSRSILIPTNHLSVYGVGYTAPSAKFTDVVNHWAKESIDYVVGRGLLSGTSETAFAPNTAMTRGMLVTALGRLAGVDTKAYTTNSFTDVKADSAFRPYIEWAYKKGVVQGIGNQQFAPDRAITREEIAVIFANFAKATGYKLPVTREATSYADASSIGSTYKTAVTAMQQAGIMMGGTDNKFSPKSNATRAEVSSMLHRYIKLTIDPATAQGWALNDAGQYLYYRDGKALTGTQTIDGVKYFFETNGVLKTGWVKDGDNWRYYSGNKAAMGWLEISDKRYYFTKDGLMVSGKWLEIDSKWYYINTDGSLAKSTKVDGYEIDENGVRKTK